MGDRSQKARCAVAAAALAALVRAAAAAAGDGAEEGAADGGAPAPGDEGDEGAATAPGERRGGEGIVVARSPVGALALGADVRVGYAYLPDESPGERNAFALHHAAIAVEGSLGAAAIDVLLGGDAAAGVVPAARRYGPGGEMRPSGEVPFLTDAAITWRIPAIGAALTVGRFVPAWGIAMPDRPARQGAISYPLYVHGNASSLGRFRNLGLEARADVAGWLSAFGGVFNGGVNSFGDDDDYKDVLVGAALRPAPGLEIRAAAFFAFARSDLELPGLEEGGLPPEGAQRHVQPILEARYRDRGLHFLLGGALDDVRRASRDPRDDVLAFGVTGHAGVIVVGDWLELFARVDYFDPDAGSGRDDQLRVTAGPQVYLDGLHGQIRVNYAFDRFGGERAMCETYLEEVGCARPQPGFEAGEPAAGAKRTASTVLVEIGVDI